MKQLLLVTLLLLISTISQAASEPVGRVILSFGKNLAVSSDGTERLLKRQADVFADDLLKTADKGRLQIRFTDGSRLALQPSTEFHIKTYRFDEAKPEDGKAIYQLLKGGMRTISGQIGKVDKEDYELDAVVATIGIRGTGFSVYKSGDKISGEVSQGAIRVAAKEGGSRDIKAGYSFQLAGADGQVNVMATPVPEADESADNAQQEGSEEENSDEESSEEESSEEESSEEESSEEESSEEESSDKEGGDSSNSEEETASDADANTAGDEASSASEGGVESNNNESDSSETSSSASGNLSGAEDSSESGMDNTSSSENVSSEVTSTEGGALSGNDEADGVSTAGAQEGATTTATQTSTADITSVSGDTTGGSTSIVATDPSSESSVTQNLSVSAPNPTGAGVSAPNGAVVAVAFTENDPARGWRSSSGRVQADEVSTLTVDNNLLTGLAYVDTSSNANCVPCTFTGPDNTGNVLNQGSKVLGNSTITWGRWGTDFSVIENGQQSETKGSFHFMYVDQLTPSSTVLARTGDWVYVLTASQGAYTSPEDALGRTGTLNYFDSSTGSGTNSFSGTYLRVNFDTDKLTEIGIEANVGAENYTLRADPNANMSLSNVLSGNDVKLAGTCSGGECAGTDLSGRITVDFVGDNTKPGAVTSYGAYGTNASSGITFSVTGTALLEGQAAP